MRLILIEGDCSPKSPFLGAMSAKSKKWRARLLSIWSVTSGDRFLLSINLHFAHFRIASVTHYSSSHRPNKQPKQPQ